MKLELFESVYRHPDTEEFTFKIPSANDEISATLIISKFNDDIRFEIPTANHGRLEIQKKNFKKYFNNLKFIKLLNTIYEDNFYDIIAKLNKLSA